MKTMSTGEGKTVCVTGASGYIASYLVKHLLLRGYTVKSSVRDPSAIREKHNTYLHSRAELLNPAVKGTLNVLNSCANTSSVKRVILTSSIAAVTYTGKPRTPDVVVDENWFTDPEYCKSLKLWSVVSKTIAEDSA
ncbi:hypothetical protein GQ457_07G043340 [Hibiscus cannabinus]